MRSTDHRTDGRRRERRTFGLKGMFVLAALGLAVATEGGLAVSEATDLFVSSPGTQSVLEYDGTTGAFVRAFVPTGSGGLNSDVGLVFGPNGDLFVASGGSVGEYNGTTGAFVRTFTQPQSVLSGAEGLVFGPNGDLFVASGGTSTVLEYNATTGAFLRTFVPSFSGGLSTPRGLVFGPNGDLFVVSGSPGVLEFNGTTGAFVRTFVPRGSGAADLSNPNDLVFGPNGNLFVTNDINVQEYNGTTGAFVTTFGPSRSFNETGLVFGPNGDLFVGSPGGRVLEFNGTTGAFVTTFVPIGSGGLSFSEEGGFLTFGPGAGPTPSVPEPSTWMLLGSGLAGLAVWRRKKAA